MKTTIIRFTCEDGVELQGSLYLPDGNKPRIGIVHVHGLAGNFYENRFVDALALSATDSGYSFLSFNNRGHDYIADIAKKENGEWKSVRGGGAYEKFSECVLDIDAAIGVMQEAGCEQVILQGHSSGANKCVISQGRKPNTAIIAVVLLSPCDDLGIQESSGKERYNDLLAHARAMVSGGNGDALMPEGAFFSYPLSAATYLEYFEAGSIRDVFPYRSGKMGMFIELNKIRVPIFVIFGNDGEYVLGDMGETIDLLKSSACECPRFESHVLDGASHSYLGHEMKLAGLIVDWIRSVA